MGVLGMGISEHNRPVGESIKVWRLYDRVTVGAEVTIQIIGNNEKDVPMFVRSIGWSLFRLTADHKPTEQNQSQTRAAHMDTIHSNDISQAIQRTITKPS